MAMILNWVPSIKKAWKGEEDFWKVFWFFDSPIIAIFYSFAINCNKILFSKIEIYFEKEKAKIEKLRHSFVVVVKLMNSAMLKTMKNVEDLLRLSNLKE
jgi:hypothetical protein